MIQKTSKIERKLANFMIDPEHWTAFKSYALTEGTDPSALLRGFVLQTIRKAARDVAAPAVPTPSKATRQK